MGKHNSFSFRFGTADESGSWVSPELSFRLKRPQQRLLVAFTYIRVEEANPGGPAGDPIVRFSPRAYLMMDLIR